MKYFLYGIVILFGVSFSYSSAEACTLNSARWNVGFARVGDAIKAQVLSSGCAGYTFSINVYEVDTFGNDLLRSIPGLQFQSNGAFGETSITLAQDDYVRGGNESGNESIMFKASANNQEISSNVIGFQTALTPTPAPPGGQPQTGGRPIEFNFSFRNPLGPDGPTNLLQLIEKVARWIMALAIPVAVIMIIYGGLLFLTAGQKPDNAKKGKEILKYAIIGLAIVLIGNGFVSLVRSVIELGGSDTPPMQQ